MHVLVASPSGSAYNTGEYGTAGKKDIYCHTARLLTFVWTGLLQAPVRFEEGYVEYPCHSLTRGEQPCHLTSVPGRAVAYWNSLLHAWEEMGAPAACRVHQDGRAGDGTERQHHMQCHLSRICADRSDTQPARRHSKGQGHLEGLHPLPDTFSRTKKEYVHIVQSCQGHEVHCRMLQLLQLAEATSAGLLHKSWRYASPTLSMRQVHSRDIIAPQRVVLDGLLHALS